MSIEAMNWARKVGRAGAELGLLGPGAILLLWSLADRADENWSCFPSIGKDLAPDSAQSERSIKRHLEVFREQGIISTETRHNNLGYRTGMRYYLHEEALKRLQREVSARRLLHEQTSSEQPIPGSEIREITGSDNLAPRTEIGENSGSDNLAPRASLSAKSDKNSQGAFNRIARGFNHQQQPHLSDEQNGAPASVSEKAPGEPFVGWEDVDDSQLVHRGVDVLALASSDSTPSNKHSIELWHLLIDLVLDRATGGVKNPNAYVKSAFTRSARALIIEAKQALEGVSQAPRAAAGATKQMKCDKHSWSGSAAAKCPSCRADALVGSIAETEVVALTEEEIQKLPEQYRHMVSPHFKPPQSFENSRSLQEIAWAATDHESVAPWDREDLVRP